MQDKIIAAIAAYLEKNCNGYGEFIHFKDYPECWDVHVATEIAAAIAPLVEAGEDNEWSNAPDWAQWLASNNKGLSQWFEDKPIWDDDIQMWDSSTEDGRYKFAGKLAKCKELKQRPK